MPLRAWSVVLLWMGAPALASEVEVFVDRGELFVRAGAQAGLRVGDEVAILGARIGETKERRRVGSAMVMEVWPSLARIAPDRAAASDKTPRKYAALSTPEPVRSDAAASGLTPPPPPPPAEEPTGMVGHAWFKGAGPWKLLMLYNDGASGWSRCNLRLQPGEMSYHLPSLRAGDHEAIALSNFSGERPEQDITRVAVTCAEGSVTIVFPE